MKKIRVVVVDDSALIRQVLTAIINAQTDMEVVAAAPHPLVAREKIRELNPDVITLDIEMPQMNGLDFLEKLMLLKPTPVVMISSLTEKGGELTMRALELGAVDFVTKPQLGVEQGLNDYAQVISDKIRAAAQARVRRLNPAALAAAAPVPHERILPVRSTEKLIIVGSSTGGTEAVYEFLMGMPPDCPGILIAQHMPEKFTRSFAQRLDRVTQLTVCEATDGQRILPGHAYVAPGNWHLVVRRSGAQYLTGLSDAPPVNHQRPSADVLFQSAAEHAGSNAMGVILTGMGRDGAAGLLAMRQAGCATFAQDEASCVVFGMPREAIALGAAEEVVSLSKMATQVLRRLLRSA